MQCAAVSTSFTEISTPVQKPRLAKVEAADRLPLAGILVGFE